MGTFKLDCKTVYDKAGNDKHIKDGIFSIFIHATVNNLFSYYVCHDAGKIFLPFHP